MKYMLVMLILLLIGSATGNLTATGDDTHGNNVESQVKWDIEWLPIPSINVSMVCDPNPALWATNCTCNVTNSGDGTLNTLAGIPNNEVGYGAQSLGESTNWDHLSAINNF